MGPATSSCNSGEGTCLAQCRDAVGELRRRRRASSHRHARCEDDCLLRDNPNGKPKGTRHRVTMAAETLMEGEAEAITRKAIELAKGGDGPALRLCMDRIYPPRKDRPVRFRLPSLDKVEDAVAAHAAILPGWR